MQVGMQVRARGVHGVETQIPHAPECSERAGVAGVANAQCPVACCISHIIYLHVACSEWSAC
jgi:hypothetical protein